MYIKAVYSKIAARLQKRQTNDHTYSLNVQTDQQV